MTHRPTSQLFPRSPLDASAKARLRESRVKPRQRVERKVINFLESMKARGEEKMGRNPCAQDLLPLFQAYAEAVFDAETREFAPLAASLADRHAVLRETTLRVIDDICRIDGVWHKVVRLAGHAAGLGTWITRFGAYGVSALMHPSRRVLTAHLWVHARGSEIELWKETVTPEPKKLVVELPKSDRGAADTCEKRAPDRASWLQERLRERGWGPQSFANEGGPDRKTLQRIYMGKPVRAMTLDKVATALSKSRGLPRVTPGEIPLLTPRTSAVSPRSSTINPDSPRQKSDTLFPCREECKETYRSKVAERFPTKKTEQKTQNVTKESYINWWTTYCWTWFGTLTFRDGISKQRASRLFRKFIAVLEEKEGTAISWVCVAEYGPENGKLHFHAVIAGVKRTDIGDATRLWRRMAGRADIQPYDPTRDGLSYLLKSLEHSDDLDFDAELRDEHSSANSMTNCSAVNRSRNVL
jgi:hypothetical protein